MAKVLLLNGPNLGILGRREPAIYGTETLSEIETSVNNQISDRGWQLIAVQSNHEGDLITAIEQNYDTVGAIVNPGALMINGWGLRDALANYPNPWIEVHLSNVFARERFRHDSVIAPLAVGVIAGLGPDSYRLAARALLDRI